MRDAATAALVLMMLLVPVACGGDAGTTAAGGDVGTEEAPATEAMAEPTETAPTEAADGATVTVSAADLGDILTDGGGATLYLFTPDEQGDPTCYDDCEQNWPVLAGPAQAGDGADAALLGTVEREDGTMQVTYNGWPLYYFAGDAAPGDTAGQGVGDVWFAVDPAGEPVKDKAGRPGQY